MTSDDRLLRRGHGLAIGLAVGGASLTWAGVGSPLLRDEPGSTVLVAGTFIAALAAAALGLARLVRDPVGVVGRLIGSGAAIALLALIALLAIVGLGQSGACCVQPTHDLITTFRSAPDWLMRAALLGALVGVPALVASAGRPDRLGEKSTIQDVPR